jgi:uridine phosphorylase
VKDTSVVAPSEFVRYTLGKRLRMLQTYDSVLLCFDPSAYDQIKRQSRGRIFGGLTGELYLLPNRLAVAGHLGIGCPAAAAFLEELIACGFRRFITIGSAGTLHRDLKFADPVLCSGAFSDEGTSRHYPGSGRPARPDRTLLRQISRWFRERGQLLVPGLAWTTDAPYRETLQKAERFRAAGAAVVEMEASALFNVARFRGVRLASVFVISDSIAGGKWEPAFQSDAVRDKLWLVAKETLNFLTVEHDRCVTKPRSTARAIDRTSSARPATARRFPQ